MPVGEFLDGCFRIGHALLGIGRAPRSAKYRRRSEPMEAHRPETKDCRSSQLGQRGLKEAFAPGAANGKLFVKRLPAQRHFGYHCICVIIPPILKTAPGVELQRIEPGNTHRGASNWDECFGLKCDLFAARSNSLGPADTKFLWMEEVVLVIRIDIVFFPAEGPAHGESKWTAGQIKQVGSVNVQVKRRELGFKNVVRMQRREFDQWYVAFDRNLKIVERIVRYRLSDKITRGRIKDWIGCVENLLESLAIAVLLLVKTQDLAVNECSIVPPASVKELVSFHTKGAQPSL